MVGFLQEALIVCQGRLQEFLAEGLQSGKRRLQECALADAHERIIHSLTGLEEVTNAQVALPENLGIRET